MSNTCPICYEPLSSSGPDYFNGHCEHSFHGSCIIKHVMYNNALCPICRVNLTNEESSPISNPLLPEVQTPPPIINPILLPPILPRIQHRPNYILNQLVQRNLDRSFNETLMNETLINIINSDQTNSYLI